MESRLGLAPTLEFNYYQEYQILGYLLYPMGRISDSLTDKLDKEANYPEIILYSKFVLTAFSLFRLLLEGKVPQKNKPADIASVASLGRNLVETYNFFFYLCLDKISDAEAEFRRLLSLYHYLHEHQRVGQKIEVSATELEQNRKNVIEEYKQNIAKHPFFKQLNPRMQKHIVAGQKAGYQERIEITSSH